MSSSAAWIDYLPEFDREQARRDPAYRDAIAKTFAGKMAQVTAAAASFDSLFDAQIETAERHLAQLRARSLRDWFRSTGVSAEHPAAMTHEQRHHLRHLIDQAKRRQLDNHKPPPGRNQAARRATYRAYYRRNRKRILAAKTARKAAGG